MDTIVALSSGSLPSGVAIIRCSGPKASIVAGLVGQLPKKPRKASFQVLRDETGSPIDSGLVFWFPAPHSFTGEDVVELQVHGSRAVVNKLLDMITSLDGVRHAEAGEFARQAFSNGRIDLTEAEGLADLIDSETEAQRKIAQVLASGGLRNLYNSWQDQLLTARSMVEADIDFTDEDDVPDSVAEDVWHKMKLLHDEISRHLEGYHRSERIRNGLRISLVGKPNVGKSSLLNALAGSEKAIVSQEAGTTRDVVETRLDLGGYLVVLSDTAGIRKGANFVEVEGIRRSFAVANTSDIVLYLSDSNEWSDLSLQGAGHIYRIKSKADLSSCDCVYEDIVCVSAHNTVSMSYFVEWLTKCVKEQFSKSNDNFSVQLRYVEHLKSCLSDITMSIKDDIGLEIRAEYLRSAAFSLGRITGQYDTEDVLGRIFSSFCIGK